MILLTRPDGGQTWVHESRVEEYRKRGFYIPAPPPREKPKEDAPVVTKKTTRKK